MGHDDPAGGPTTTRVPNGARAPPCSRACGRRGGTTPLPVFAAAPLRTAAVCNSCRARRSTGHGKHDPRLSRLTHKLTRKGMTSRKAANWRAYFLHLFVTPDARRGSVFSACLKDCQWGWWGSGDTTSGQGRSSDVPRQRAGSQARWADADHACRGARDDASAGKAAGRRDARNIRLCALAVPPLRRVYCLPRNSATYGSWPRSGRPASRPYCRRCCSLRRRPLS